MFSAASSDAIPLIWQKSFLLVCTILLVLTSTILAFLYVRKHHYFCKLLFYIAPAKMGSVQARTIFTSRYYDLHITYFKPLKKSIVINIAVSSTDAQLLPVGEEQNFKEQTITVCGEQRLHLIRRLKFYTNPTTKLSKYVWRLLTQDQAWFRLSIWSLRKTLA